ncbi:MAG: SGNH/GDSL hydrolase family protein [Thermoanaerobaculia bacterium]
MGSKTFDRFCLRLGRTGAVAAVVLAPLCLAEAAARLFHDPPPVRRVWDPFAYRIPQPLLVDEFESLDGERVTVRLNELGMRGPPIAEPAPAHALTVVFLGGSTTENYAFDRRDTFPELIGEQVSAGLGRPLRIFNAGMSAATTSVSLGRLQHQVLDLEPSLIVVMHGINDLVSGFHPHFRRDGRHLTRPALAGTMPRSYLLDWIRRRRARQVDGTSRRVPFDAWDDFAALDVFARNLRSMAAVAGAHEIPILFLTQATMYRQQPLPGDEERLLMAARWFHDFETHPDVPSLARGMGAFNAATLRVAAEDGDHAYDLAAVLPQSVDLIFDDCHFTQAGNRRVAAELSPVVEDILKNRPKPW